MDSKMKDVSHHESVFQETVQTHEIIDYQEFQNASVFYNGYEGDDEVFVEFEKSSESSTLFNRQPRIRRISDVIDSVGDVSPTRRHSYSDIYHKESSVEYKEVRESISRQIEMKSVRGGEQMLSPPATPSSGYSSTGGLNTPPSVSLKPKWFTYTSSTVDPQWDTTDARPIYYGSYSSSIKVQQSSMPVGRESEEYNMKHPQRGFAVIFNHEEFNNDMPSRKGSDVDVQQLSASYQMLGFKVEIYNNLDCDKLRAVIKDLSERDHSNCDCLLITVLTHGLKSNYLFASDYAYPAETLWLPFTADKCLSLAGKPKIFIIQACRGEALDGGVRLVSNTQTDTASSSYKIPTMADFLIAYSTAEGFYSWRHPEKGTWFIQSLCQVLTEQYLSTDLLKIMTRVSHRVAIDFESYNEHFLDQHERKQVPNMHSTLIRDVYFRSKA